MLVAPTPPAPKPPHEKLAPVTLTADEEKSANELYESFAADVAKYRASTPRGKPDEKALAELVKKYASARKSVDSTCHDALLTYKMIEAYEHGGDTDKVIELYTNAVTRFAGSAEAHRLRVHLARYYLDRMNDSKTAAGLLRANSPPPPMPLEAHGVDPWLITRDNYVESRITLARCELRDGKIEEAKEHFADLEAGLQNLRAAHTQECDRFDADLKQAEKK